jgi:hypothetical protein
MQTGFLDIVAYIAVQCNVGNISFPETHLEVDNNVSDWLRCSQLFILSRDSLLKIVC